MTFAESMAQVEESLDREVAFVMAKSEQTLRDLGVDEDVAEDLLNNLRSDCEAFRAQHLAEIKAWLQPTRH